MENVVKNGFAELSENEMSEIDGGLFGCAAITAVVLLKVVGAGITVGAGAVAIYYSSKK